MRAGHFLTFSVGVVRYRVQLSLIALQKAPALFRISIMAVYSLSYSGVEAKFSNTETNVLTTTTDVVGKAADMLTGTTFLGLGKIAVAGYVGMVFNTHKQAIKNANKGKGVIIFAPWLSFSSGLLFGLQIKTRT
jgi:hypothetical protein